MNRIVEEDDERGEVKKKLGGGRGLKGRSRHDGGARFDIKRVLHRGYGGLFVWFFGCLGHENAWIIQLVVYFFCVVKLNIVGLDGSTMKILWWLS